LAATEGREEPQMAEEIPAEKGREKNGSGLREG